MIHIHKEGISILITSLLIFIGITALAAYFLKSNWLVTSIGLIFLLLFGFMLWFFRNPSRQSQAEPLDIVAPVDGKVVEIKKVYEKEYLKRECIQLSIFMSPLNVHVCRYPTMGTVTYTKYHPGKYLVAFHPKSSELNERTTVVVENQGQEVLFRQIAGAVARRIVLYAEEGDQAQAGEEYGFIKFGSRLDVFLPLDTDIKVEVGQKTKGALDVIAQLKNKK